MAKIPKSNHDNKITVYINFINKRLIYLKFEGEKKSEHTVLTRPSCL
jgi:hypothetical protein